MFRYIVQLIEPTIIRQNTIRVIHEIVIKKNIISV